MQKDYMEEALKEAQKAFLLGEIPVGCVIVSDNKIIARGHNQKEKYNNSILHAEIIAIQKACKKKKSWRLNDCDIYITLEPCMMCYGACLESRINKINYIIKNNYNLLQPKKDNLIKNDTYEGKYKKMIQIFFEKMR